MRYRKLDSNGDYVLGTGQDFYVNSPEAVAHAVQTRLALYRGQWFLDTTDGTPWRTDVLGKFTKQAYDSVIQNRILGTEGVTSIVSYDSQYDPNNRKLSIQCTINTAYGQSTFTGAV